MVKSKGFIRKLSERGFIRLKDLEDFLNHLRSSLKF